MSSSNTVDRKGEEDEIRPYWIVVRGRAPGIYNNWALAHEQINEFSNNKHVKLYCTNSQARAYMREEAKKNPEHAAWEDFTDEKPADVAVNKTYYTKVQHANTGTGLVRHAQEQELFMDTEGYKQFKKGGEQAAEKPELALVLQAYQRAVTERDQRKLRRHFEERIDLDEDIDKLLKEEIEDYQAAYIALLDSSSKTQHAKIVRAYLKRQTYRFAKVKAASDFRHNCHTFWHNDALDAQQELVETLCEARGKINT